MKRDLGLWRTVGWYLTPVTVMAEWRMVLGREFEFTEVFLRPTDLFASAYPCTEDPVCSCAHEIFAHAPDCIRAVCRCPMRHCRTFEIQSQDRLLYELDRRDLCRAIRDCL